MAEAAIESGYYKDDELSEALRAAGYSGTSDDSWNWPMAMPFMASITDFMAGNQGHARILATGAATS